MLPKYKSNTYKGEKKLLSKKFAWRGIFIKKATTAGPPSPQFHSQPRWSTFRERGVSAVDVCSAVGPATVGFVCAQHVQTFSLVIIP